MQYSDSDAGYTFQDDGLQAYLAAGPGGTSRSCT